MTGGTGRAVRVRAVRRRRSDETAIRVECGKCGRSVDMVIGIEVEGEEVLRALGDERLVRHALGVLDCPHGGDVVREWEVEEE